MRVGWLADPGNMDGTVGGAELTQQEFRDTVPEGVEIVDVPSAELDRLGDCDVAVVHNTVTYPKKTIGYLTGGRVVRYWHDVAPHGDPTLTRWLLANARSVFCSPLHYDRFPWRAGCDVDHDLIPPQVPLERFRAAGNAANGRSGAVALGPWMNWDKGPQSATEWAIMVNENKLDFYGGGPLAPMTSQQVEYDDMPRILAKYQTFVHLPRAIEPFGRTVVEAWAAGCQIVTNRLVGARYWIEEAPEKLETAAEDFWKLVCDDS